METEKKLPTEEDLRQVPKEQIVDATVNSIDVKTWRELVPQEKLDKFENPDEEQIIVKYEYEGFVREEKFRNDAKPTTTSKTGRYLVKYGKFEEGQNIKVYFDDEGKSSIVLAK